MSKKPKWKAITLAVETEIYEALDEIAKARGEAIDDVAASMLTEVVRDSAEA